MVYISQQLFEKAREQFQMLVSSDLERDLRDRAQEKLDYLENRN
jgi:hypothetical protein